MGREESGLLIFPRPSSPERPSERRFRSQSYRSKILPSGLLALQETIETSPLGRHLEVPLPVRPPFHAQAGLCNTLDPGEGR